MKNSWTVYIFVLLQVLHLDICAQEKHHNFEIDSLESLLETDIPDSTRLNVLYELTTHLNERIKVTRLSSDSALVEKYVEKGIGLAKALKISG